MTKKTERTIKKNKPEYLNSKDLPNMTEACVFQDNQVTEADVIPSSSTTSLRIPAKFINPETGEVKLEELIKSYLALERRFSERCSQSFGVRPERPEDYHITLKSELLKRDSEMEKMLFDLGFTNEQAQAVYDLAVEKVIPVLKSLSADVRTEKELAALEQEFGGPEQFNQIGRQISAWAEKHLNPEIFDILASSKDGILALYQMMQERNETPLLSEREPAPRADTEETLRRLMQDPKYWRQHDPKLVQRVEEGFKRLYGSNAGSGR